MVSITKMSNSQLLDEYDTYNQLVNVTACFGAKDVMHFDEVCREMDKREL